MPTKRYVINRHGNRVKISYDKIRDRLDIVCEKLGITEESIDTDELMKTLMENVTNGMKTTDIDILLAKECICRVVENTDYADLASAITVSNLHRSLLPNNHTFSSMVNVAANHIHHEDNSQFPLIDANWCQFVNDNCDRINSAIDYDRDYKIDYFGFLTLTKGKYLLRNSHNEILETPQDMYMRVAVAVYSTMGIDMVIEAYNYLSFHCYTHATPTMINAMTPCSQYASCFLIAHKDDSIEGMYGGPDQLGTVSEMATIMKNSGGIGVHLHKVRSAGESVQTTNGKTNGLKPYLRVYNELSHHVDQAGKRPGAIAVYLTPMHPDFPDVMKMRRQDGAEQDRARSLFYGCWIPDIFMKRIVDAYDTENKTPEERHNIMWSFFDPKKQPELYDLWGDEYEALYLKLESENKFKCQIRIIDMWKDIMQTQRLTGMPYMLYSDSANRTSNQQNIGKIDSSNLCTEIIEYSDPNETAVCNLASMSLPAFMVETTDGVYEFDHAKYHKAVKFAIRGLNCVIDVNRYPSKPGKVSNSRHRPIGLGIQGLADVFMMANIPFESPEAKQLNFDIFETMYHAAMESSMEIAIENGTPYETFAGSPLSKGQFQFDLWESKIEHSGRYNWDDLRAKIIQNGVMNSLCLTLMPTAGSSQIMGNTECFEGIPGNIYRRETKNGTFVVFNKHFRRLLKKKNKYTQETVNSIILNEGSVQHLDFLSDHEKRVYKTIWEISQRCVIDLAADRGHYICQSASLNIYMENPKIAKLTALHIYGWKKGLITGLYYLRSRSAARENKMLGITSKTPAPALPIVVSPIQSPSDVKSNAPMATKDRIDEDDDEYVGQVCTMEDGCVSCGS